MVQWVDRGGDVTYHGPGQLVEYPIVPLAPQGLGGTSQEDPSRLPNLAYTDYLRKLEAVLIRALVCFGVAGETLQRMTGVWLPPEELARFPLLPVVLRQQPTKLASIGVKVTARGVAYHGFALNVSPGMSYWQGIIACGLENQSQVSLADLLGDAVADGSGNGCGDGSLWGGDGLGDGLEVW
jgi:lipoate-protein ligase B